MTAKTNDEEKKFKHKKLVIILSSVLAVILVLVSCFFVFVKIGEIRLRNKLSGNNAKLPANNSESIPDDADAFYDGTAYDYNDRLINILLLGVDKKSIDSEGKHQADSIYLISLDTDEKKINVIAISRNTLAEIDITDANDNYFSTDKRQICLAYSFGKDDKNSSELTSKAVSKFLYNVPISGYYTIFLNSIPEIVDSVGGVPIHITEDMTDLSPEFKVGADVILKGNKAKLFLQYRKESNAPRLERQKKFILSFFSVAKKAVLKDLSLPVKMYDKLATNSVTDVSPSSVAYLASEATKADFKIHSISGKNGFDGLFETFTADDDQLYQLLLDVFYKKHK